jgi:hypothetical protein
MGPEQDIHMTTADSLRGALVVAIAKIEDLTSELVAAELRELVPLWDRNVRSMAYRAKEAEHALQPGIDELAAVDAEIERVKATAGMYEARISDTSAEMRVEARWRHEQYLEELDRLDDKRTQISNDLGELKAVSNSALKDAKDAVMSRLSLEAAIADPLSSQLGQATHAYGQFRQGELWRVIIGENDTHPEWDAAVEQVRILASAAGFELKPTDDGARAKRMMDDYKSENLTDEPAPTGQDVINAHTSLMTSIGENKRLAESASRTKPEPGYMAVPPRDYMTLPGR